MKFNGADLGRADFKAEYLYGAEFSGANLRGANFGGAKLGAANLSKANLEEADLSGADLTRASLRETNLGAANLNRANLVGADLGRANLRGANLRGANLRGANFSETNLGLVDLRGMNLSGAKLAGADLAGVDLAGADLTEANLSAANLRKANLRGAKLVRADLTWADLHTANLSTADLTEANLKEADLSSADLRETLVSDSNLSGATLTATDLRLANLIDAKLDRANLTGAKLWEAQRSGWSIRDVICERAFWDRAGEEPIAYGEGEFARIFAEKPRIVLRYPGGITPVDLFALPLIVQRLQAEHPDSVLQVRSVQNDGGGASVTITVEDQASRGAEAFGQELVRLQTKLECIVEERDHLRQRLEAMFSEAFSKTAELLLRPSQEIHIHRPSGLTAIEGPTMSQDVNITGNISGQIGAIGHGAGVHDNTLQQVQGSIDLRKLAEELERLHGSMKAETTGTREQDKAIVAVADAQEAAAKGDGSAALQYLQGVGKWGLGIAERIGVAVATEALKRAM